MVPVDVTEKATAETLAVAGDPQTRDSHPSGGRTSNSRRKGALSSEILSRGSLARDTLSRDTLVEDALVRDTVEREIKIGNVDLGAIERSLTKLGAVLVASPFWERNWVLDRDGELRASGRMLRVRETRSPDGSVLGVLLTVKAPLEVSRQQAAEARGLKERLEHETAVPEARAILATLRLLGYPCSRRYEKVRSVWQLRDHEVVLDQTPIGNFVEVEGADPRPIVEALGLLLEHADLRSYLGIYEDYRKCHASASEDMVFQDLAPEGFEALATELRTMDLAETMASETLVTRMSSEPSRG